MPNHYRTARALAKSWAGVSDEPQLGAHYNGGKLRKDFVSSIQNAFGNTQGQEQPFSGSFWGNKLAYNPSFGDVPDGLQPQVTRALDRGEQQPDQIQDELNTTTERVQGTTNVAPAAPGDEPVGYGGSGDTGVKSYQLGHASTAGESTITAPVAAPPMAASTTPSVNVSGSIAPSVAPPAPSPAAAAPPPAAAPPAPAPAPSAAPSPAASSGNQGVAPALRAPSAPGA